MQQRQISARHSQNDWPSRCNDNAVKMCPRLPCSATTIKLNTQRKKSNYSYTVVAITDGWCVEVQTVPRITMKVVSTSTPELLNVWYMPSHLSQSEAFRALVESQNEHATKFVICLISRQIQLIKTAKHQTTQVTLYQMIK